MNRTAPFLLILSIIPAASCSSRSVAVPDEDPPVADEANADTEANRLFGLVYTQQGIEGCSSYYFDARDDTDISYESCDPIMDNGNLGPDRQHFVSTSLEVAERVFLGTLDWSAPEGGTVEVAERWVYEMLFDGDCAFVAGGSLSFYSSSGEVLREYSFSASSSRLPRYPPKPASGALVGRAEDLAALPAGAAEGVQKDSQTSCPLNI